MDFFSKLFGSSNYQLQGENLNILSEIVYKTLKGEAGAKDAKKLENFITSNNQNPYLYQICATLYFRNGEKDKADLYLDKAIELNIKDGGYSLLTKAYNNMRGGLSTYDAVVALRFLIDNKEAIILQINESSKSGIFPSKNEFGFLSFYIDLSNSDMLAEIYYSLSTCCFDFGEQTEAIEYIQKAIELCPSEVEFRTKYEIFRQQSK
jgi:tetratricopeptide (TPR) repeat protein